MHRTDQQYDVKINRLTAMAHKQDASTELKKKTV
jgi:hypothetical protein